MIRDWIIVKRLKPGSEPDPLEHMTKALEIFREIINKFAKSVGFTYHYVTKWISLKIINVLLSYNDWFNSFIILY